MSVINERRNFLRHVMHTTKAISSSTIKVFHSFEKGVRHSVDDDINTVGQVCRRIVLGIEQIDQDDARVDQTHPW